MNNIKYVSFSTLRYCKLNMKLSLYALLQLKTVIPVISSRDSFGAYSQHNQIRRYCSEGVHHDVQLPLDIEYNELVRKLESKEALLIDVRTPEEYINEGHIPGAVNIPLTPLGPALLLSPEEFESNYGIKKPSKDASLVTSCKSGVRARTAQLAFVGAGYTGVRRYGGSFTDWLEKGGMVYFPPQQNMENE